MEAERDDMLNTIIAEADKINRTLNNLHAKFISHNSTIENEVGHAMKALELALEIIIRNTDVRTNTVAPSVFERVQCDKLMLRLQRIGFLSRRLEREVKTQGGGSISR